MESLQGKHIVVTGGLSFIGSHLVDRLIQTEEVARVTIFDDESTGSRQNLPKLFDAHNPNPDYLNKVDYYVVNLLNIELDRLDEAMENGDALVHLAAVHGGRGMIEGGRSNYEFSHNLELDARMVRAAVEMEVPQFIYGSTGCVYPVEQRGPGLVHMFTEPDVGPPYHPDTLYGFTKLAGERALRAACASGQLDGWSLRICSVYGPRMKSDHAVGSWIRQLCEGKGEAGAPVTVWGDGTQRRNWTYVDDTVDAIVRALKTPGGAGRALNVGRTTAFPVNMALGFVGRAWDGREGRDWYQFVDGPTGPHTLATEWVGAWHAIGWYPRTAFGDGIRSTIEWAREAWKL